MKAYEGEEEKPKIEATKNAFKIILPNINAKNEKRNNKESNIKSTIESATVGENVLDEEALIIDYARSHEFITRNDVIELLKVSTSTASRILQRLVKSSVLKQCGKARGTRYTMIKSLNSSL